MFYNKCIVCNYLLSVCFIFRVSSEVEGGQWIHMWALNIGIGV